MKIKGNELIRHLVQCPVHSNLCFGKEMQKGILQPVGRSPLLKKNAKILVCL